MSDKFDKESKVNCASKSNSNEERGIVECPCPNFSDFNEVKDGSCFAVNQLWAAYDDADGMPRFYAWIKKVRSPGFKLQITWLEASPKNKDEQDWCDGELPISCGKFEKGETEYIEDLRMFSHEMHCIKGISRGTYFVYPMKGETWALFKDWDMRWSSEPDKRRPPYRYEIVEIVTDYSRDNGIGVAHLGKVRGFISIFMQTASNGVLSLCIPLDELFRFSHRIPSFRMTGKEGLGMPAGSFELDTASLPSNLFNSGGPADMNMKHTDIEISCSDCKSMKNEVKATMTSENICTPKRNESYPGRGTSILGRSPREFSCPRKSDAQVYAHQCDEKNGNSVVSPGNLTCPEGSNPSSQASDRINTPKKWRKSELEVESLIMSEKFDEGSKVYGESNSKEELGIIDCPNPDFSNFEKDKTGNCFDVNQVWAVYDSADTMPRFYARIKKVHSPGFKLQITWLEASPENKYEQDWCDGELPISCGKFEKGETQYAENPLIFSHQMHRISGISRGTYFIYPKMGETWALFKGWDMKWSSDPEKHRPPYQFDIVEIVTDFSKDNGIEVAYLGKVRGFISIFKQTTSDGIHTFCIPPSELFKFSHRIPSFRMSGDEGVGVPSGTFELDPTSLPSELFDRGEPGYMNMKNMDIKISCLDSKSKEQELKATMNSEKICTQKKNGSSPKMGDSIIGRSPRELNGTPKNDAQVDGDQWRKEDGRKVVKCKEELAKELELTKVVLKSIKKNLRSHQKHLKWKEQDLRVIQMAIKDQTENLRSKEKLLKSVQTSIEECSKELIEMKEQQSLVRMSIMQSSQELKSEEKNLDLARKSLKECCDELESKKAQLESIQRTSCELSKGLEEKERHSDSLKIASLERLKELQMKERQFDECVKELELKEKKFDSIKKSVEGHGKEVELKQKLLNNSLHLRVVIKQHENFTADSNSMSASLQCCIPSDGANLQLLLNQHLAMHDLVLNEVCTAIQSSSGPAKLVLDAMLGFYPLGLNSGNVDFHVDIIRRSCITLLKFLSKISPIIESQVRGEAMKLAVEWRLKMRAKPENSLEVLGFLQLLAAFQLAPAFSAVELRRLLDAIKQRGQDPELRQRLGITDNLAGSRLPVCSSSASLRSNANSTEGISQPVPFVCVCEPVSAHQEVFAILKFSSDPAKLVLNVMQGFRKNQNASFDASSLSSKILLLEHLMTISPDISPSLKEEALGLALLWEAKMRLETKNSMEVLGFLLFLAVYGLGSHFKRDHIFELVGIVLKHKQAAEICQALGLMDVPAGCIAELEKHKGGGMQIVPSSGCIDQPQLHHRIHPTSSRIVQLHNQIFRSQNQLQGNHKRPRTSTFADQNRQCHG